LKSAAFAIGAFVPFVPLLWLYIQSPELTKFNVFDYHFFYRQMDWDGAIQHDFEVLTSWIDSSQAMFLGLLALAGLFALRKIDRPKRSEFYLCAWLALAESLHISNAHPTFARYFLFTVPFLSILASLGLYSVGTRLARPDRPWRPVIVASVLLSLGLGKA